MSLPAPPFMITASGLAFPLLKPEPQHVRLRDISRHLAKTNRFSGATRECYSVAQHSVHVCEWLAAKKATPLMQLHGLLHDAHEAYTGDITRPMKAALNARGAQSQLSDIEDEIQFAIMQAFDMSDADAVQSSLRSVEIMRADAAVLAAEFRDLMPDSSFNPQAPPAPFAIRPLAWDIAEEKFLKRFHQLAAIAGITPIMGALE